MVQGKRTNSKPKLAEVVMRHIDTTPEDKLYTFLPEFLEDEEQ